jgi:thioredoxin 2
MAIVACPNCGAKNRVDERAAVLQPVCGRCGAELDRKAALGQPIEVTDRTFAQIVLGAGARPVLLDCWAPWCGPCQALTPVIDALAAEAGGRYVVAKLNTDENPRTARQFHIQSIPMLLIFKNGALVDQMMGLQSQAAIEAKLAAHISAVG